MANTKQRTEKAHAHDGCEHDHHAHDCCEHDHHAHDCCEHDHHAHDCCDHDHSAHCGCGHDHETETPLRRQILILSVALVSLIASFFWHFENVLQYMDPAWIAVILCGREIVESAGRSLRRRHVTSDVLVTVAIFASVLLAFFTYCGWMPKEEESYLFAAGEVAFLMYLGEMLEHATVEKSRAGLKRLLSLAPQTANLLKDGKLVTVDAQTLQIGDIVLVRPDDLIPADGKIVKGETAVDQSAVTGESVPADKTVGDEVYGGTQNGSGAIEVAVTKSPKEMAVAKMAALALEAEGKKAPISSVADKWASVIVPSAIVLSVLVGLFAFFVLHASALQALIRGVTILVVFCPCALTLATPTAVAAGIGSAASAGVLFKSGEALQRLETVNTVAFDKTGTLTKGVLSVTDAACPEMEETEFWKYLKGAESLSQHPIAKAILQANAALPYPADKAESMAGTGIRCEIGGKNVIAAKIAYFDRKPPQAQAWEQEGKTVIGMSVDGVLCGIVALADVLKEETPQAIALLQKRGIEPVLLTGDQPYAALQAAKQAGIGHVEHSLLPHQKLETIRAYQQSGKQVCMVGDGVNDAPALAAADCGIAMGALGSDIAIETADVALFADDIQKVPWILRLSRRVMRTVRINIALSMLINFAAVILSAFGLLSPVTGALLHNASSVLVVLHACTLLLIKA